MKTMKMIITTMVINLINIIIRCARRMDDDDDNAFAPFGHTGPAGEAPKWEALVANASSKTTPGFNAWPLSARDHHGLAAWHREILRADEHRSEWHEASRVPFCGPHQLHASRLFAVLVRGARVRPALEEQLRGQLRSRQGLRSERRRS